jgi:hypothetical protein
MRSIQGDVKVHFSSPVLATWHIRSKNRHIAHDGTLKQTHCLIRIASRKSSFLLFKLICSHDVAPVLEKRPQLRSSVREQEKKKVFVREKEEDFA